MPVGSPTSSAAPGHTARKPLAALTALTPPLLGALSPCEPSPIPSLSPVPPHLPDLHPHQANGSLLEPVPVAAPAKVASFGELMAFGGEAPELINGRLAQLGVVAAIGAELASGESVFKQLADEPTLIVATFGLIIAATFVPLLQNISPSAEVFGPFNAAAEKLNGRAAMIGFAALVAIEAVKGSALF